MTRHGCIGLFLLGSLPFACGGDGGSSVTDTVTADTVTADTSGPEDHRILVASTAITGRQGDLLLVSGPGNASRLCAAIDADPFTLSATALMEPSQDGNPCGAATPELRFVDGGYVLSAGVYVPGSQTPVAATAAAVQVAGADATAQLDGGKLSAGAVASSPGRILVAATAITGRQGKALLVTAGGARACAMIDADPWTLSATAMTAMLNDGNPCGAATAEFTFPGGDTVVNAAIFTPGSQTPEATTSAVAAVDGDVTVTVDGSALSGP